MEWPVSLGQAKVCNQKSTCHENSPMPSWSCFNSPLSSEFSRSGQAKSEQSVELRLHITVLVNGKYALDLIFKKGKSAYFMARIFSSLFKWPRTYIPRKPGSPLGFLLFYPLFIALPCPSMLSYPYRKAELSKSWRLVVGHWFWIIPVSGALDSALILTWAPHQHYGAPERVHQLRDGGVFRKYQNQCY